MNLKKQRIWSVAIVGMVIFLALGSSDSGSSGTTTGGGDIGDTRSQDPPSTPQKADLEVLDYSSKSEQFARYVVGTVRNNSNKNYSYVQVEINLLDKGGSIVGSTLANVNNLGPGQKWKFKALIMEESAARFEIKDVTGF